MKVFSISKSMKVIVFEIPLGWNENLIFTKKGYRHRPPIIVAVTPIMGLSESNKIDDTIKIPKIKAPFLLLKDGVE